MPVGRIDPLVRRGRNSTKSIGGSEYRQGVMG
jgi:hypothetical protein